MTKGQGKGKPKLKQPLKSYTIKDGEASRKSVVATKGIKQGSVILTESPIMYVKAVSDDNIISVFNELDVKEKEKVLTMVPVKSNRKDDQDETKVLDLFQRKNINQFGGGGQALYYVLSRIRHSCAPNIALIPILETNYGSIEVRACRAIKKGEDLCADYLPAINTFETKAVRSATFGENFICDCEVCVRVDNELEENEKIRGSIKEQYRNTTICVTLGNFVGAFDSCRKMLGYMEKIELEVMLKIISVTLECWQLAVLAQLQDPTLEDVGIEKFKNDSLRLCKILGKCEVDKWKVTEQCIATKAFQEFDTIKLRAKGPWAFTYIQKLSEENKNTVESLAGDGNGPVGVPEE